MEDDAIEIIRMIPDGWAGYMVVASAQMALAILMWYLAWFISGRDPVSEKE